MNVLIDARSLPEYLHLRRIAEAVEGVTVFRAPLLGREKLQRHYDVIVSARSDERNMSLAERWQGTWGDTFIILVMDSGENRLDAMRCHVFDYLTRPIDEARLARSLHDAATHFAKTPRRKAL
ncbi:MAG: hypothetical protein E7422_06480 [Ruminococcaceae bacterium]|jgi:DNA-binding NtrC family response regulator|nr:hypothetical protein [Oscillospiraceae bacterium]